MKKILISVLFFYVLALAQTSFIFHLDILNVIPNLILIAAILLIFFEESNKKTGLVTAGIGGFFLDLFSYSYIGTSIIALIVLAFLLKKFLQISAERNVIHLILVLIFSFVFYSLSLAFLNSFFLQTSFFKLITIDKFIIFELLYNLGAGIIFYFLIKCSKKVLKK